MSQAEQPNKNQTQNQDSSQASNIPQQCKGGCGFYGNKDYSGYCSVCFKQNLTTEQQEQLLAKQKNNNDNNNNENKEDTSNNDNNDEPKKKVQKKKNRCWHCRKKITLAGRFECKCGYIFCSAHRFADAHECDFDYQTEHKNKLEKMNEKVAPAKLNKI